jgi:Ca2+-binding RTX toxin-like protein
VYEKTSDGDIAITDQSVAENRADALVGILSKDGLTQLSPFGSLFTITGPDADKFQVSIDGTTLRLKTGTVLDYETQTSYNITITALGVSKDYQITVVDGEENEITGQHSSVASSETITGTAADDFIDYDGGNDTVDGKSGNDILIIDQDKTSAFEILTVGGITKIKVGSSASVDYRYDNVKMVNVESIKFNDQYIALDTNLPSNNIVWGTSSSESINDDLTNGDDLIDSAGGNDKILDNGGNDTLVIFSDKSNFEIMTVAGLTKIYGDTSVSGIGYAYYANIIKTLGIENIAFIDQTVTLDNTKPSGTKWIYWNRTSESETITATDEIDLIDGSGGSDTINGKDGNDTTQNNVNCHLRSSP